MDLIRQAIKALELFARHTSDDPGWTTARFRILPSDFQAAADALAVLRKAEAEIEQEFEEWWSEHAIDFVDAHVSAASYLANREVARAAYRAAKLARIPTEIREALVEACDVTAMTLCEKGDPGAAERYAKARAWLAEHQPPSDSAAAGLASTTVPRS